MSNSQPSTSRSGHEFSKVPKAEILRSSFDRSSGYKTSFNAGDLVPFFLDEALPGDTFNLRTSGFARLSTPIYPIMDNMMLSTFYFAVPNRLLWKNWERFMGEQDNPADSTDFQVPQLDMSSGAGYTEQTIGDYMGLPLGVINIGVSALPFRAYNLIWNEWLRDENLQDSVTVNLEDGPDSLVVYPVHKRGKRFDYFTSCMPWPQKGPDVNLPLGTSAPIQRTGADADDFRYGGTPDPAGTITNSSGGTAGGWNSGTGGNPDGQTISLNHQNFTTDLTNATASTINALRLSFQVQKLYERDARGGTRYTELIKAHFNVTSPDSRLQRPEYLGGGMTHVNINPVTSMAGNVDPSAATIRDLGSLSAVGTSSFSGHGFTKSFTEHTTIIGMCCVHADLTYQQGLNRMFSRENRFDFYWPALAQIGEQAVLNKEIYATGVPEEDDAVFGYQERFAEMRYKPSLITGKLRSTVATGSLDAWHLAQNFATAPKLGAEFIVENPPVARVVAVPEEPQFIADFYHKLTCARPMPLYGVPGNMDRF